MSLTRSLTRPLTSRIARDLASPSAGGGASGEAVAPDAPTIGTATAGNAQASVTFTAPADNGGSAITGYRVTSSPGGFTATGASSPIVVTGLTNGVAYTFTVAATNAVGYGAESAASNAVTPVGVVIALTNRSVPDSDDALGSTAGGITLARSGALYFSAANWNSGGAGTSEWVSAGRSATVGDGYEVRMTVTSGSVSANRNNTTPGVWTRINSDRQLYLGPPSGIFTVEIRPFGGGATLATATITVT